MPPARKALLRPLGLNCDSPSLCILTHFSFLNRPYSHLSSYHTYIRIYICITLLHITHLYIIYLVVYMLYISCWLSLPKNNLVLFTAVSQDLEWCLVHQRNSISICLRNERTGLPASTLTYPPYRWDLLSETQIWPHYLTTSNASMPSCCQHVTMATTVAVAWSYHFYRLVSHAHLQLPRPYPPNIPAMCNDYGVPKHATLFLPSTPSWGTGPWLPLTAGQTLKSHPSSPAVSCTILLLQVTEPCRV